MRCKQEIVWRFQMVMLYIMTDSGRCMRLSGGNCNPDDVEATLRYIRHCCLTVCVALVDLDS